MANTIRIGTFEVSSFKVGLKDPKIYLGDILLYPTGGYKVCYAVVNDITQYIDREYEDVYDKATEKWYKLNNLNQYEEYGIYGSGRNVTTYEGKLTIDDGYEYEWNGSSWVNLGEVSGSSRVPQGYTELTYCTVPKQSTEKFVVPYELQPYYKYSMEFTPLDFWTSSYYAMLCADYSYSNNLQLFKLDNGWGTQWRRFSNTFGNYTFDTRSGNFQDKYTVFENVKAKISFNLSGYTIGQGAVITVENEGSSTYTGVSTTTASSSYNPTYGIRTMYMMCGEGNQYGKTANMKFHNFKVETSGGTAIYDYIPTKRDSDNKVGIYDVVHNEFYVPSALILTAGDEASHTEYPKYYTEKSEPLDNLTFNTLAEAQAYAEANCVYVGLKAAINGDRYIFSGDSQSGYEWVYNPSRLPQGYTEVEYIENTDYASLEINYKPNQDTRIVTTMQASQTGMQSYMRFFGSGHWNCSDGNHGYQFDYETRISGTLHISWGAICGWTNTSVHGDYNSHTYDWNKNEFYRDNTLVASTTYQNFQCENNLGIFSQIMYSGRPPYTTGDERQEYLRGKMYDFKIYNNGTLVVDLVPCINPSNVVGAYDVVNDVFYTAINQGYSFVAGDPV